MAKSLLEASVLECWYQWGVADGLNDGLFQHMSTRIVDADFVFGIGCIARASGRDVWRTTSTCQLSAMPSRLFVDSP